MEKFFFLFIVRQEKEEEEKRLEKEGRPWKTIHVARRRSTSTMQNAFLSCFDLVQANVTRAATSDWSTSVLPLCPESKFS